MACNRGGDGSQFGYQEAAARVLAAQGYHVVVGARRVDRITALADEIGGTGRQLDVTDEASVAAFVDGLDRIDLLVNNAGGAKGTRVGGRVRPRRLALDVGDQRGGHAAADQGATARTDRLG